MKFRSATETDAALIEFYRSLGAEPMDEWTTYRISGETLDRLAGE